MKPSEFNSTETESFISDKNNGVVTKSFENAFKHCYVETRTGLCSRDLQLSSKNNEHLFFATITSPSLGSDRTIGFTEASISYKMTLPMEKSFKFSCFLVEIEDELQNQAGVL